MLASMSTDESGQGASRPKLITPVEVPPGPAAAFRDALYDLYLRSGPLTLNEIVRRIQKAEADDPDVLGVPGRDVIHQMISGKALPVKLLDAVTVARLLARAAGSDPGSADRQIRELFVAARTPPRRLGRPITDCDPIELEVHRAIVVPGHDRLPVLPVYVAREHDIRLRAVIDGVTRGRSRIVTLVGESSTGKTRACWEAIQPLAHKPVSWRVWHPFDPSGPDAAAHAIANVGPHTVVWLNEAQHYLLTPDSRLGERVAAGLRTLLSDATRRPVLVLATMWRQHWVTATTTPSKPGQPDPHSQARQLLTGTDIAVPDTFSDADFQALQAASAADSRLRHAAENAPQRRITQHLAGVPELLARYRNPGTPAARAIIDVAIDARRLGHPPAIPHAILAHAAPGYLDDHQWEQAGDDWLERALAFTAAPCHGVPGPVTRIRPRPGDPVTVGMRYRLADALDQVGRTERAGSYPPESLWTALITTITDPDLLRHFGWQAQLRGRYQHAIWLYVAAADRGAADALRALADLRERAGDTAGAEALFRQAADRGDAGALRKLAERRERAGDAAGADALYWRAADCGDTDAQLHLALQSEKAGNVEVAEAVASVAADRGNTNVLRLLATVRMRAGDAASAEALYRERADRGDADALRELAGLRIQTGDVAGAEALYRQAADRGDSLALRELAALRMRAGDPVGAEALATQAADLGDVQGLWNLTVQLEMAGNSAGAEALANRTADRGDTGGLLVLATARARLGNAAGAEALYRQAADRGDTNAPRDLARRREQTGNIAGAESLYRQALDRGNLMTLYDLARLREQAGDHAAANRIQAFGLTPTGETATSLDFGSYGGLIPQRDPG